MNRTAIVITAIVAIGIAGAAGYWAGTARTAGAPAVSAAGTASAGAPAAKGSGGAGGQPVTVEATKVATASLPQSITAVGSLRSDESVMVRPEVAGRVAAILFKEGQRVPKGALLVRLDTAINDADVRQARANYVLAKSKFDRAVDLQKQGFISAQARDEAENNFKVAEASVSLATAKFDKTEIRAPFTGVLGLRAVSVGDYVKEGADIVNLEAIDPLKLDFRVPEIYFAQLRAGQPLEIALDAEPGRTFPGHVYAVNPLVDAAGRSVVVRAQVPNPDTSLRPGMFARVRLITRSQRDALVVPEQALVPQGEDQFIFRVVDGRAQRVKVEVGQRRDGKAEILKGIEAQDVVVTAGQLKLRDGVPLKITRVDAAAKADPGSEGALSDPARPRTAKAAPTPPPAKAEANGAGARS